MTRFGLEQPARRNRGEPIIPMINVVFLLLIFFLLSASIAPPEPLPVDPPDADGQPPEQIFAPLLVSASGELAYADAQGDDVWPLLARRDPVADMPVRADAGVAAAQLVAILARLAATTPAPVVLVVEPRGDRP